LTCPGKAGPKRSSWMVWLMLSLLASACSCRKGRKGGMGRGVGSVAAHEG
jgi:hypothetical protein